METDIAKALNQEIRRIAETLADPGGDDNPYAFVCECGCGQTVMISLDQFDREGGAWLEGHKPR